MHALKSTAANYLVHAVRVTLVFCLLGLLHRPPLADSAAVEAPPLNAVRQVIPQAERITETADAAGCWNVFSDDGQLLGRVARTLPAAANIRGYRGATEAIIAIDDQNLITAVDVLHSRDTAEHVVAVRNDSEFLNQFVGWRFTLSNPSATVDAVSGATLTSLAMARGILSRLGDAPESLVFPEPLTQEEQQDYIRTGPLVDDIIGYQGPTELLFKVSEEGVVEQIKIRKSFDNEPYVEYVAEDRYFWKIFADKTVEQLADFDLVEMQVEGVSGATMTSQAVAATIVAAANELRTREQDAVSHEYGDAEEFFRRSTVSTTELATVAWILLVGVFVYFKIQRRRFWRTLWLIGTLLILGVWAGNLLSMSLLVGWSSAGTAATIAPGLALLCMVALLAPPLAKANPYCSHLCPHGAVQQILRPRGITDSKRRRWQWKPSPRLQRLLKWIPGATLVIGYLLVLLRPQTDLASWEPFHAYLFPIASVATLILFVVSVAASAFVPMAYCRFGCPTGSLLDYLRRTAVSRRVTWVDGIIFVLVAVAVIIRVTNVA